ncbi:MAG: carbohydrate-binding family 9-like protein [Armatimonadetes bacterium]|nr:carbohydrate-binding family 9-like protein [Armatimonadota bacterium]
MAVNTVLVCVLVLGLGFSATVAAGDGVPYGLASWPEQGRGNHRAVLRVSQKADAVRAHIEWRRRDLHPEAKDVRIYDATTGERVLNVVRVSITQEAGDLVFQPPTVPGEYYVYYLPYNPGRGNFDDPGSYFTPEDTADAEWVERNRLTPQDLAAGTWQQLPQAELVAIQARDEFNRRDPMEVIATSAETQALLSAHSGRTYLLFPEDREHQIKMFEALPLRWIEHGPSEHFRGEARPGEYYPFQIGVWAARRDIKGLELHFSDLTSRRGDRIAAAALTCFNLEGTDWLGRPMTKPFAVGRGRVRPLWIGVQVPRKARGTYRGVVTIKPSGAEESHVQVTLRVSGDVLEDAGDADLWRLSRLRWLNSTLGIEDKVVPPFVPLQVHGDRVKCLRRTVTFGPVGLPRSIESWGHEVLARPMEFVAETDGGRQHWQAGRRRVLKANEAVVQWRTLSHSPDFNLALESKMEFDGCVAFTAALTARRDADVEDLRLEVPLRREIARYMMGMSRRGGLRPASWDWKWDVRRVDNMVWLGDVKAGLQVKLGPQKEVWEMSSLHDAGLPASWHNGGRGGCHISEVGDEVLVQAYSGPRKMKAGDKLVFRFRLLITPFKPIDPRHWQWRVGDVGGAANILHVHHASSVNPYINYPFIKAGDLASLVRSVRAIKTLRTDPGWLTYPAEGNINLQRGALHVWVQIHFDPTAGEPRNSRYNQPLLHLDFPNGDQIGFYWNVDDRGMRGYVRKGRPGHCTYPVLIGSHSPDWRRGQRHLVTLSWGDRFQIAVDGKVLASANYRGTLDTPLAGAELHFHGDGFSFDAIKLTDQPFGPGSPVPRPEVDEHTLLLDTFARWDGGNKTRPEKTGNGPGALTGTVEKLPGEYGPQIHLTWRSRPCQPKGINLYYTVRELSNHCAEMWALRSLGDEVFRTGGYSIYTGPPLVEVKLPGGYPWLKEHLVAGYVPAWRQPLPGGMDAAIATQGLSRWHNYYLEGLRWLMENTGVDGLYLDGIGYDREIMKRVARVMHAANPDSRINFHSGNEYDYQDRRVSPANKYMEHLPYISWLWFGEMYDYNRSPDYWLVEISGLPFGLTSEMLNYQNGGNPYRGMIYGMSGRQHPSAPAMWHFWDEFGIQDAEMIGYWDEACPVRTDSPQVLATVYRKKGKALVALAHWPGESRQPTATVRATARAPKIDGRIEPGEWDEAARLTNFIVLDGDELAEQQTEVFVTFDAQRLYLAFRCQRGASALKGDARTRDGEVWKDDAIEVFLQPDPQQGRYVQFVGNSRGVFLDGEGMDKTWNGDWVYRASVGEGYWEGEASVSWAALGMKPPREGQQMGVNFCRDQQTPRQVLSSWARASATFHRVSDFGRLVFSTSQAPTRQARRAKDSSRLQVRLIVDWKALGLDPRRTHITAPPIEHFQPGASFAVGQAIPIERAKGWLLVFSED